MDNNCVYVNIHEEGGYPPYPTAPCLNARCCLKAKRDINKGEELFVYYGAELCDFIAHQVLAEATGVVAAL